MDKYWWVTRYNYYRDEEKRYLKNGEVIGKVNLDDLSLSEKYIGFCLTTGKYKDFYTEKEAMIWVEKECRPKKKKTVPAPFGL